MVTDTDTLAAEVPLSKSVCPLQKLHKYAYNIFVSYKHANHSRKKNEYGQRRVFIYCWFSFALTFQLFRAVESSSLFHLCNLLIFCVLEDVALIS